MNAPREAHLSEPIREHAAELSVSAWQEANRHWLTAGFQRLAARLETYTQGEPTLPTPGEVDAEPPADAGRVAAARGFLPDLPHLGQVFGLSDFERELLLLCAGVELHAPLQRAVALAQQALCGPAATASPSFGLALAVLPTAHWDALSPEAPLRRWRLIHAGGDGPLLDAGLRIDERVLHHLCGLPATDERLEGIVQYLASSPGRPSASARTRRVAQWLAQTGSRTPLVVIDTDPQHGPETRDEALAALAESGRHALWLRAHDLPDDPRALARVAAALDREALLTPAWPVVSIDAFGETPEALEPRVSGLLAHLRTPAIVMGAFGPQACHALPMRRVHRLPSRSADPAARARRREDLRAGLGERSGAALRDAVEPALQQFELDRVALEAAIDQAEAHSAGPHELADQVWQACREQARGGLDLLARRVAGSVGLNDLVLPSGHLRVLHEITQHLRQRGRVYDEWGMGGKAERGRGLCALFAGDSGTGKTLAAEAIANEAGLDLYRVDLATVVSKYIGETEKNLKRLFDAAQSSGAVLLFDEADALFGKRSEVKDSHDRYANVEIAYLLQSIEAYRGLAILTTNLKSAIDRAFLRRIRFVLQFPFPDAAARERIWRQQFPSTAPVEAVDFAALARATLTGGSIRNVALNAAFHAASGPGRITHDVVVAALRDEFTKLERSLGDAQLAGRP